jgi:hypothetical protein
MLSEMCSLKLIFKDGIVRNRLFTIETGKRMNIMQFNGVRDIYQLKRRENEQDRIVT